MAKESTPRTSISLAEHVVIDALKAVTMLPGHSDKRFLRDVSTLSSLTDGQRARLLAMRWKYRRQIGAAVPLLAEGEAAAVEARLRAA